MKVKDVMHSGVSWVEPDTKLSAVAQIMQTEDIGAVPIGESDRLIGMVTDRDIACRGLANGKASETLTARDVMSEGITWCKDDEEIEDALRIMEKRKIRRLPVINDEKRMVGMLSLGDIASSLPQDLTGEVMRAVAEHHA
ncbi:CBS domain-containing protein [Hoeflea sp. TYP-13]|uniref:CBS domain-containing protein n=1 Tax=Hoeflea sp. TYP-13 TaxID=3230023 RepID=UPI0034C643B2